MGARGRKVLSRDIKHGGTGDIERKEGDVNC